MGANLLAFGLSSCGAISSSIAESAVNEVVSHRMAKKRQVRWYDEGAHLLAQVGVHELNDQPKPREISTPLAQTEWRRDLKWDAYHPPQVAA